MNPGKTERLFRASAVTLAAVIVLAGCGGGKETRRELMLIPEEIQELDIDYCGLYVWYRADEVMTELEDRNRFLDICNNGREIWGKDINEIYMYVDLSEYGQGAVADFIDRAQGIDVYILSSAGVWCCPVGEDVVNESGDSLRQTMVEESQAWIEEIKRYQLNNPDSGFRGLHLDFEYDFLGWKADPEHYARFIGYYCAFLDRCRRELPGMTIGIDVTCAWADWELESAEYDLEDLARRVDYMNIMAYRDEAGDGGGREETVRDFAGSWVELLKAIDKDFMIAVEASEFDAAPGQDSFEPLHPEKATVFEERERINEFMGAIADGYNRDCPDLFRGEALHYYQSIQLWQIMERDYSSGHPQPVIELDGKTLLEGEPVEVARGREVLVSVPLVRSEDFSDRKVKVDLETFKRNADEGNRMEQVVDFTPGESAKSATFQLSFESTGIYDLLVTVWDIDFNTLDQVDRVTRLTHSYRAGDANPPEILDSSLLEGSVLVI